MIALLVAALIAAPCSSAQPLAEGEAAPCAGVLVPTGDVDALLSWRERALLAEAEVRALRASAEVRATMATQERAAWDNHARYLIDTARKPVVVEAGLPVWATVTLTALGVGAGLAVGVLAER